MKIRDLRKRKKVFRTIKIRPAEAEMQTAGRVILIFSVQQVLAVAHHGDIDSGGVLQAEEAELVAGLFIIDVP